MKKHRIPSLTLPILIALIVVGCEAEPAGSQIAVTPGSASISKGQSVEFTASGGYDYTWSLSEDSSGSEAYGALSTRTGPRTIYTSLRDAGGNPVVRVLTVTSTIVGAESTNSSPAEWTTHAYITHR